MRSETKPSQDEEKNEQEPLLPPIQPVIDFGSVVIKNSRAAIHCLTIAGQIEGRIKHRMVDYFSDYVRLCHEPNSD